VAVICDHIYRSGVVFVRPFPYLVFFSDEAREILIKGGMVAQWWGLRVTIKRSWVQFPARAVHSGVMTLGKVAIPMCPCSQLV